MIDSHGSSHGFVINSFVIDKARVSWFDCVFLEHHIHLGLVGFDLLISQLIEIKLIVVNLDSL